MSFTLKVRYDDQSAFRRYLATAPAVGDQRRARTFGFRYAHTLGSDAYMEYGDKASGVGSTDSDLVVRLDFNPNNVEDGLLEDMAGWLTSSPWNITRLDVALDYEADFGSTVMFHESLRKTVRYGDAVHETLYFGARDGVRLFRCYDKNRERAARGSGAGTDASGGAGDVPPWWRIEVQHRCRGNNPLPEGLFDGLVVCNPMPWNELRTTDYAVARTLLQEPDYLNRFRCHKDKSRWRERVASLAGVLCPSPQEAYESARTSLAVELWSMQQGLREAVMA